MSSYTAPAILLGSWRALLLAGVRSLPTPQSPSSFGSATPALPFLTTASADVHSRYCRRLLVRPLSCCCCRYRLFVLFLLNSSPPPPPLFCSGDDNNIERRRSSSSEAELNCRRGRKTGQAAAAKGGTLNTGWCMCAVKAEDGGWVYGCRSIYIYAQRATLLEETEYGIGSTRFLCFGQSKSVLGTLNITSWKDP